LVCNSILLRKARPTSLLQRKEEVLPIKGFEDAYFLKPDGTVISKERWVQALAGRKFRVTTKVMTHYWKRDRAYVILHKEGKRIVKWIDTLLEETFNV
jgi:hypothetical protein